MDSVESRRLSFQRIRTILRESESIVFFGGAGVSTASGIPDFRSATGLYNRKNETDFSPEYMLSHAFFEEHPDAFSDYVRDALIYPEAEPNGAHIALAELERRGQLLSVVTQNIDGLHQRAGSRRVLEIHGNLTDYHCASCGRKNSAEAFFSQRGAVHCPVCGGVIRPEVVLYGEPLNERVFSEAIADIHRARTLIVGGSSLVVYPAAGLLQYYRGNELILINAEPTPADRQADVVLHGDLSTLLPSLIAEE